MSDQRTNRGWAWIGGGFGLAFLAYLAFRLSGVLLFFSAAVLLAVGLDGLGQQVAQRLGIGRTIGVLGVVVLVFLLSGLGLAVAGPGVSATLASLFDSLRTAADVVAERMRELAVGRAFLAALPDDPAQTLAETAAVREAASAAEATVSGVASSLMVVVVAVYLALDPDAYRTAVLKLIPPRRRGRARSVANHLGHVLRRWLIGRLASMAVIGVLTWLGLALLGVPSAFGLALVAMILSFIPFLGPLLSVVPATLLAAAELGTTSALYVLGLYGAIQALETAVITPQIEKLAVSLPPAFIITVQVCFGILGGLPGIVMASPLAVAIVVMIQMLYVQDVIGEDIPVLAEEHKV